MAKSERSASKDRDERDSPELGLVPTCPHLSKSLSASRLRKAIASGELGDLNNCKDCEQEPENREKDVEEEKEGELVNEEFPEDILATVKAIWVCLQCANRGCSRYTPHRHAEKHQNKAHSDAHDVALNCYSWQVWCYQCNDYINPSQTKPLEITIQALQNIRAKSKKKNQNKDFQHAPTQQATSSSVEIKPEPPLVEDAVSTFENIKVKILKTPCDELKRPKGLTNLGNTCFFNSVMQNLAQTHLLTDACIAAVKNDVLWTVQPLGKASVIRDLKTLELTLGDPAELTLALAEFFKEFLLGSKDTFSPGSVFHQICAKSPQFRGYQQQDSQELLRHLFEGVFNEESKRMKAAILANFGLKKNVAPGSVKPHIRQQIDSYKKQTHHTFLETVFGGLLINTILCLRCRKSSQNFEPFVDLSLPIAATKCRKVSAQRRADPIMDDLEEAYKPTKKEGPSKHQLKVAKKNKKKQQRNRRDAARKGSISTDAAAKEGSPAHSVTSADNESRSGDNSSSERGETGSEPDDEQEEAKCSSTTNDNDVKDVDSILAKVGEIGINQRRRASNENHSEVDSGVDVICPNDEEDELIQKHKDVWKELSLSTLGDRSSLPTTEDSSHSFSIASCLGAFTDLEVLSGKNQFGCDHCTDEHGKTGKDGKKERVYTDAQMQLLVLIPPAVLTLHLKRFVQNGMRLSKNSATVSFPKILDLAPFCSKACINLPSMKPGQKKILYSLYGIVQHSGSLHGGHYTAYVKVRPNTQHGEKFLQPLPLKMGLDDLIREMHRRCEKQNGTSSEGESIEQEAHASTASAVDEEEIEIPEGRWYHISDSFVKKSSESEVLNAEAYLIFYERLT